MQTKTKSTKSKNNPRINLNKWFEDHKEFKKVVETRAENYLLSNLVKNMRILSVVIAFLSIILGVIIGYLI